MWDVVLAGALISVAKAMESMWDVVLAGALISLAKAQFFKYI
jgi:hypothetical protein